MAKKQQNTSNGLGKVFLPGLAVCVGAGVLMYFFSGTNLASETMAMQRQLLEKSSDPISSKNAIREIMRNIDQLPAQEIRKVRQDLGRSVGQLSKQSAEKYLQLSKAEINYRRKQFYDPYHNAISKFLKERKKKKSFVCIVSIHSFTPKLNSQDPRPWHIGILWDRDKRISDLLLQDLKKNKDICIGENKPYSGNLVGDTLYQHGTSNNIPHVLIEFRNDLINSKFGQKKWTLFLASF